MRCGSVTHNFNPDQRWIGLRITNRANNTLTLRSPPNGNVAPPGYYLLFALRNGVPSIGHFIQVGAAAISTLLRFRMEVMADSSGILLEVPNLGPLVATVSDPATSCYIRFKNRSVGQVTIKDVSGVVHNLVPNGWLDYAFDRTSSDLHWAIMSAEPRIPAWTVDIHCENAREPTEMNASHFRGSISPWTP